MRSIVDQICLDKQFADACLEDGLRNEIVDANQAGEVLDFLGVVRGQHADVWLYGLYPCLFARILQVHLDGFRCLETV